MKLKKVRITNFRSVEDSEEFDLDHIACLVGKNEAGKTAILQALAALHPHTATPMELDTVRDYPRRYLTQYEERHSDGDAVVVETEWKISKKEVAAIEEAFCPGVVTDRKVTIRRRYEAKGNEWVVNIDFAKAIAQMINEANFSASESSQVGTPTTTQDLRNTLKNIAEPTQKHQALLAKIDGLHGKYVNTHVRHLLSDFLPEFMYFSNYDRMSGEVRLDHLKQRVDDESLFDDADYSGDRLFYEFLEYAGVDLDEILQAQNYEPFTAKLQAASNTLTDTIIEYWSQNPYIEVRITVDAAKPGDKPPFNEGVIARARIYNSLHRVDVPFSERSAGFIWFFSFLIKFAQVAEDTPIILLLDEPGLSLHGKAQADLLRYFDEELAPYYQIVYSTHSPFMVDPNRLLSSRVVEDVIHDTGKGRPQTEGTKVREDVLNRDPDTIFPLQGALGYEITQSLFIGKNTLLVEGPSDILYLQALSAALKKRGRTELDPRWTICPSGGIGKIMPFVTLFKGNDLNIGVLTDYVKGDKKKVEELRATEILKSGAVLTAAEFTGKSEADVEDFFDPDIFVRILNCAYNLTGENALTIEKLDDADKSTPRLIKKAEAYFKLLPDTIPMLDHYTPSQWLIENPSVLEGDDQSVLDTLDCAQAAFEALNKLVD